jgi:serine protease Do
MSSFVKLGSAVFAVLLVCGLALPTSHAQQSRQSPMMFQLNPSGAYLGIEMDDVTASNMAKYKLSSEKGVIVRSVQKRSPAEDAKLQEDDVIIEYGGSAVWSAAQLARLVQETPSGRKVDLVVSRDGKRINVTAQIGTREGRRSENRFEVLPGDQLGQLFRDFQFRNRLDPREGGTRESARKPRLGVTLMQLTDQLGERLGVPGKRGALVSSVLDGSPAAGKLQPEDVVIKADSKEIREPDDLIQAVNDKAEGALSLKVIRDKKEINVIVTLPALPAEEGKGIKL